MRGSRNFHERGSNENGNFWLQTRGGGGPTSKKSRNYLFLGKIFKFQWGGGVSGPPVLPSGSAHDAFIKTILRGKIKYTFFDLMTVNILLNIHHVDL